jgi:type VI secretion system protein ImpJ
MMVHWHEGLFLLPQHLQLQQKFVLDRLEAERPLIHRFRYGVIDLDLNVTGEMIAVRRLKAVMRSGVFVDFQTNAAIAPAEGVAAEIARSSGRPFKVSLGLPLWSENQPNAFDIGEDPSPLRKRRYCLREESVADENHGGDKKPVWIRQFNARLLLESESEQAVGMEILPLARIEPSSSSQLPTIDVLFAPPLLRLKGWRPLFDMVQKLVNQIGLARTSLRAQIQEGTFSLENLHGNQLDLLFRLRTVNHFLPRLEALTEADQAAPFEIFCELASMCGELMALDPGSDPLALRGFAHDSPADQLAKLDQKIREYLEPTSRHSYVEVKFVFQGAKDRTWRAKAEKALMEGALEVYLRADSADQRDDVIALITSPIRCGLRPGSLATRPINGVPLKDVNTPKGLPAQQNFHYFRVERSVDPDAARLWKRILEEQEAAVYWASKETTKIDNLSFFVITSG